MKTIAAIALAAGLLAGAQAVAQDTAKILGTFKDWEVHSFQEGGANNVSYSSHLAGAAYGFCAARFGWIWSDPLARLEARVEVRNESNRVDDARKLDELLQKINREGIQSLSTRERAFLKRMSARK